MAQENIRELVIDELEDTAAGRRVAAIIEVSGGRLFIDYQVAWPGGPLMPVYNFVPRS
jgi:hypothetical protein